MSEMGPGQLERVSAGQQGGVLPKQSKTGQGPSSGSKLDWASEGREVSQAGGLGDAGNNWEEQCTYFLM